MTRAIGYVRGSAVITDTRDHDPEETTDAHGAHGAHGAHPVQDPWDANDELDELDAQDAAIVIAARDRGLDLARTYTDAALDDEYPLPRRPGLLNAIGILEPGDTLVVASADRLGPDPVQLAMVERLVASKGCRVLVAAPRDAPAGDDTIAGRRLTEALAEYEQFVIAARPAPRPRRRPAADAAGPDPVPAAAIRAIIEGHVRAGWQAADIADQLNRRGLRHPAGAAWTGADVRTIGRMTEHGGAVRAGSLAPAAVRAPVARRESAAVSVHT